MGHLGCSLFDELEGSGISIEFVIDRVCGHLNEICRFRTVDEISGVDVVIVTVSKEEEHIKQELQEKTDVDILTITELLSGC